MKITCGICGFDNPGDAEICQRCGVALVRSELVLSGDFEIRVMGETRAAFTLTAPEAEGYVVGRTDDGSDYMPDIDLAAHGGREQGVSRRHAALVRYRGAIHIVDLNSVNGTFLNGKRLLPETPYPLNVGDSLKLGNLQVSLAHARR